MQRLVFRYYSLFPLRPSSARIYLAEKSLFAPPLSARSTERPIAKIARRCGLITKRQEMPRLHAPRPPARIAQALCLLDQKAANQPLPAPTTNRLGHFSPSPLAMHDLIPFSTCRRVNRIRRCSTTSETSFTAQGSTMTSPVRIRAFDSAYYPILLRQALADPALCYTFVAMSATYSSVHGQCLDAPDARLLSIYGRTFRTLRRQIGQTGRARPSEATVMAAVNLLMCHGIGFGDKQALTAHHED